MRAPPVRRPGSRCRRASARRRDRRIHYQRRRDRLRPGAGRSPSAGRCRHARVARPGRRADVRGVGAPTAANATRAARAPHGNAVQARPVQRACSPLQHESGQGESERDVTGLRGHPVDVGRKRADDDQQREADGHDPASWQPASSEPAHEQAAADAQAKQPQREQDAAADERSGQGGYLYRLGRPRCAPSFVFSRSAEWTEGRRYRQTATLRHSTGQYASGMSDTTSRASGAQSGESARRQVLVWH